MDVIGQYYAPHVKSKKERVTSKDKIASFDQASWDDYDVRMRRLFKLEKRLADLREDDVIESTPVYKPETMDPSTWVGMAANEQNDDQRGRPSVQTIRALRAYQANQEEEK